MFKKSCTSSFFFSYPCSDVFSAVINNDNVKPSDYNFEEMTDEEFESQKKQAFDEGQFLVRITKMVPDEQCSYILYAKNFDIIWEAKFTPVKDECRLTIKETYLFHKDAFIQYLFGLMFIRLRDQHRFFFQEIRESLKNR